MNRPGHNEVDFFLGKEVEKTPAFGLDTLFVVGVQSTDDISINLHGCKHIFFGANHSFHPNTAMEWSTWERMITYFLERGYLCTLDIPITHVEEFHDGGLCEFNNFIPQIRLSMPFVKLWNYNTMVKIDDRDFDSTNPGVWCHSLHDLMDRSKFTSWDQYDEDTVV